MLRRLLAQVRLLPLVMALGAVVLVIKMVGIVHDARAQDYAPGAATAEPPAAAAVAQAEADDSEASSAEMDVLTSLSKRRGELDARARDLQTQQELVAAAERRLDDKIAGLKTLESRIQTLLGERDSVEQKQIDALVKTYASMRPRDAARIFDLLSDSVLIDVSSRMKPDVLGAILAQMQPELAQKLTVRLANRLNPTDTPPAQISPAVAQPPASPPSASATQQPAPGTPPAAAPTTPVAAAPLPANPQASADSGAAPSSAK